MDSSLAHPPPGKVFERGDVLIYGLDNCITSCIIDIRVTDTDQLTYLLTTPVKGITMQERSKKKKCLESCQEQRRRLVAYVVGTYGLLGEEAQVFNKHIGLKLVGKWKSPCSAVTRIVNPWVSVAILWAAHIFIRGSRVPYRHISTNRSDWDDGVGLGLGLF